MYKGLKREKKIGQMVIFYQVKQNKEWNNSFLHKGLEKKLVRWSSVAGLSLYSNELFQAWYCLLRINEIPGILPS